MAGTWTFGQKIAAGFALVVAISALSGLVFVSTLRKVVETKDRVIDVNARNLVHAGSLSVAIELKSAAFRGHLLTRDPVYLQKAAEARREIQGVLAILKERAYSKEDQRLLAGIEQAEIDHQAATDKATTAGQADLQPVEMERYFMKEISPKKEMLQKRMLEFMDRQESLLKEGKEDSDRRVATSIRLLVGLLALIILFAVAVAFYLTRTLSRQIGGAIQHVQSSASELQAAANQQATGAREQSTSMNEIATTISELLATSRQIAESSQRVAQISGETAQAAGSGDQTVQKSQESINIIRRQVDTIVSHMLDLGKKSQQIGGILEIINELAEQTNILAINASVEAAGAGDSGRRFAVVADEIRKLADRVGGSTKEIRSLIEEIRAAVNTTVMATEGGAKSVEAGTKLFAEVALAFQKIMGLVETSAEAAKEIELSTKQQSTAVEQVNVAISNVAQATKETETSAGQTLQTAGQLTTLSRELARLVQSANADSAHR